MSGAAMHALDIIGDHPELFRGVVVNTGMMPYHLPGNVYLTEPCTGWTTATAFSPMRSRLVGGDSIRMRTG